MGLWKSTNKQIMRNKKWKISFRVRVTRGVYLTRHPPFFSLLWPRHTPKCRPKCVNLMILLSFSSSFFFSSKSDDLNQKIIFFLVRVTYSSGGISCIFTTFSRFLWALHLLLPNIVLILHFVSVLQNSGRQLKLCFRTCSVTNLKMLHFDGRSGS